MPPVEDWLAWHAPYDDPGSPLARRLRVVQAQVAAWLRADVGGDGRILSVCAGQGRDLLPLLAAAPGGDARRAVLIEADPRNAAAAREAAAGLGGVEVRCADAGVLANYEGAMPADLLLLCGVLGNIDDADVRRTVGALPHLVADDATVIWTRTREAPDLTPAVRGWLAEAGFDEQAFVAPPDVLFSVGVHRLTRRVSVEPPPRRLFRFVR